MLHSSTMNPAMRTSRAHHIHVKNHNLSTRMISARVNTHTQHKNTVRSRSGGAHVKWCSRHPRVLFRSTNGEYTCVGRVSEGGQAHEAHSSEAATGQQRSSSAAKRQCGDVPFWDSRPLHVKPLNPKRQRKLVIQILVWIIDENLYNLLHL